MKKVLLFVLIFFTLFSSAKLTASEYDPYTSKLDAIHFLMEAGINSNKHETWPHSKDNRKIFKGSEPFKPKFCKQKNSDETFVVLSNQGCYYWDKNQSTSKKIKPVKGKKISEKKYKELNPDYSKKNNLICIDISNRNASEIFFLTHTKDNNVYLNGSAEIKRFRHSNFGHLPWEDIPITLDDVNDKQKWIKKGESVKSQEGYTFIFQKYIDKKTDWKAGLRNTLKINSNKKGDNFSKCYADKSYWTAMYSDTNDLKNTEVVKTKEDRELELQKRLEEEIKAKEEQETITTKNKTTTVKKSSFTSSIPKIGIYEKIVYPLEMKNKLGNRDPSRVAGTEVSFRFIKKKSTLSKYPNKLMEAMAWMEVLYNEKIKHPQRVKFDDVKGLLEARNSMRESVGLDINVSAQDAIDTYWVMSILLSKTKYEKRDVDPALLERKKALNDLKTALRKAKEKYLEEVQGDKS